MGDTKPDLFQGARLLPAEGGCHVAQVKGSLVEVAIVEVVLRLKTFLQSTQHCISTFNTSARSNAPQLRDCNYSVSR